MTNVNKCGKFHSDIQSGQKVNFNVVSANELATFSIPMRKKVTHDQTVKSTGALCYFCCQFFVFFLLEISD